MWRQWTQLTRHINIFKAILYVYTHYVKYILHLHVYLYSMVFYINRKISVILFKKNYVTRSVENSCRYQKQHKVGTICCSTVKAIQECYGDKDWYNVFDFSFCIVKWTYAKKDVNKLFYIKQYSSTVQLVSHGQALLSCGLHALRAKKRVWYNHCLNPVLAPTRIVVGDD